MKLNKRRRNVYLIALILSLLRMVALRFLYPEIGSLPQAIIAAIGWAFIVFIFETVEFVHRTLNRRMPFEQGVFRRLALQIALCVSVTFTLHTLSLFFFIDQFPIKVDRLTLLASYFVDFSLVVAINAGYFGFYFFDQWKMKLTETERLAKEKALAQKEHAQVQFDNLKNQLNPHFLFNSLASLNSLIFENQELASQFLQQLSKVYRYVLENKDKELVNLRAEINFIQHYIKLLKTRFSDGLLIDITLTQHHEERLIVPVTLQILIENAIKHNIIDEQHPLRIHIFVDGDFLLVQNTLQRKSLIEYSNGMGLENMKILYSYLSPMPIEVLETDRIFSVKIPLV